MEIKTSQCSNRPSVGVALNRNITAYLEPASNLDSISHGLVLNADKSCGTSGLTDEKLYYLCRKYGDVALRYRNKFIGLLPEVEKRQLYKKKGCNTVFEFAYKLAGLSEEQVRLALNMGKRVADKPTLKRMLENGEVSINKLTRAISIATPENEAELAEQIKVLPVSALNTLVRDQKAGIITTPSENPNGFNKPLFDGKGLYVQTLNFDLADDIKHELNELNSKGIDVNELIRKMLMGRKEEIAQKKEEIAENTGEEPTKSRYIPACVRDILKQEHGNKCSITTCAKPAQIIHHTQRYGLSQNHDPRFLAPLCKDHHAIAHSMDIKYQQARSRPY